jgi:hypothetical protein
LRICQSVGPRNSLNVEHALKKIRSNKEIRGATNFIVSVRIIKLSLFFVLRNSLLSGSEGTMEGMIVEDERKGQQFSNSDNETSQRLFCGNKGTDGEHLR